MKKYPKKNRPNIILLIMDATRADHLSCCGYFRKTTPNLDRIAAESTLFENAISAAPWTLPAQASIMTGLFPSKHGVRHGQNYFLQNDIPTIAHTLQKEGYQTVGFSTNGWISQYTGLSRGFNVFKQVSSIARTSAGRQYFKLIKRTQNKIHKILTKTRDKGAYLVNKLSMEWLERNYSKNSPPFFIYIHYMEPHSKYYPPKPYNGLYLDNSLKSIDIKRINQDPNDYIMGNVEMTEEDFEVLRSLYDGEISYLDFRMNELFSFLKKRDILDDTLLIVTADHGENIGDHDLMGHQLCLYDTLLKVPLIIRYPEIFPRGKRISKQVQTVDIFPTILDIVEVEGEGLKKELQGKSLTELLEFNPLDPFTIAEHFRSPLTEAAKKYPNFDFSVFPLQLKAIRTNGFKYIWSSDGEDELYNLKEDPGELNNLISHLPEKALELKARLFSWVDSFKMAERVEDCPEFDEDLRKQLRALGYLS